MSTIYINTRQAEESRIVIVQNGELVGFEQDVAGWENKKGDIYKAVVTRIEEGLDAAFVDFGEPKNGFLPLRYVSPDLPGASGGEHKVAEGDSILVQIKKDHVSDKGPGMTTNISLAGSYLVLMPNSPGGARSLISKSGSGRDRQKTAEAMSGLNVPDGMSVIVRTAGVGRPSEDLRWDLESYLLKLWGMVEEAAQANTKPVLIYRENNLILRAVRDYYRPGEDRIYCDDPNTYEEMKSFLGIISPEHADCVHLHEDPGSMVPDDVERQVDSIFHREIKTPSGARLVFDSTEAMTTIDVNSAQMRGHRDIEATALRANLEAADAIARHLRLRDMSGLIVADFIDMVPEENRKKLEDHFIHLLRKDRAHVQWTPISRFGMMELSRQRLSRPVEDSQSVVCNACHGTGRQRRPESFALRLLRQLDMQLRGSKGVGALVVQAPADAAIYLLNEKRADLRQLEERNNCDILIAPSPSMHAPDFHVRKIAASGVPGMSHRMVQEEETHASDMANRHQAKNASPRRALIETVMPEERKTDGAFARMWKAFSSLWGGDAKSAASSQRRKSRRSSGRKRGNAKASSQAQPADSSAGAQPAARSNRSRRRGGRRGERQPAASAEAAPRNGGSDARMERPARSGVGRENGYEPRRSEERPRAESRRPAAQPADLYSPETYASPPPPPSPPLAEASPPLPPPQSSLPADASPPASPPPSSPPAAEPSLARRLAEQYGKSEEEMRGALAAVGASENGGGEITPELTAQLDAHFESIRSRPKEDDSLVMIETSGDAGGEVELNQDVRELSGEPATPRNRPPSESTPLRQVETGSSQ